MDPNSETSTAGQGGNTNKPGDKKYKKSVKLKKEKNTGDKQKKGCC